MLKIRSYLVIPVEKQAKGKYISVFGSMFQKIQYETTFKKVRLLPD